MYWLNQLESSFKQQLQVAKDYWDRDHKHDKFVGR